MTETQYAALTSGTSARAALRKRRSRERKTTAAERPLEKEVQAAIVAYLTQIGATAIRVNSGRLPNAEGRRVVRANSLPGCPDVLACIRGRFVAVEVKRPGGAGPTPLQREAHERLRRSGGLVIVARSIDDLQAALQEAGYPV
jgi:hypothetical protein